MSTPKKFKKINNKEKAEQINDAFSSIENVYKNNNSTSQYGVEKKKKKLGRIPLLENRVAKIFFRFTPETANRFNIASMQEQSKSLKKGEKLDKSLLAENIIKEWLDTHKY